MRALRIIFLWKLWKLYNLLKSRYYALFGVVDDTTTTKLTSRACAVHCNLLPVVVDKVVVVILKFPKVTRRRRPPVDRGNQ